MHTSIRLAFCYHVYIYICVCVCMRIYIYIYSYSPCKGYQMLLVIYAYTYIYTHTDNLVTLGRYNDSTFICPRRTLYAPPRLTIQESNLSATLMRPGLQGNTCLRVSAFELDRITQHCIYTSAHKSRYPACNICRHE